ncbi:MAG: RNA methyltransferase [Anaerolineae bacterium]|nr:RNA methyltransferase [Anaerolineae bacterium]MDW8072460.1 RNA methyltransferase [Anaerolineae bacterium]
MITSRRNPRIVALRKLDMRKYRWQQRRFRVEGLQLLHMALDAGARPLEVLYCREQFTGQEAPRLLQRFAQAGATLLEVSPEVMQSVCEREIGQGLVATFALGETALRPLPIRSHDLVIVLDRLQDPGNMGTLIRTADAVGAAAAVLIEPCVDPYEPKAVRGSMGSLFHVPLVMTADLPRLFAWLTEQGLRIVGADAHVGEPWGDVTLRGGVALVLGNEARGISADVRPYVQDWVRLPIVGKAESLNVAVAGGVLMYTWLRRNLGNTLADPAPLHTSYKDKSVSQVGGELEAPA